MSDFKYEIQGAPVVYTNRAPEPYNPLNRPKISFLKPVIILVAFVLFHVLGVVVYHYALKDVVAPKIIGVIMAIFDVVFLFLISKRTIIWLVHLYQRYAPDEVRLKCVYEPSCSEYMIMAVKKYGVLKGLSKGIGRLLRCHPPNGGQDLP